MNIGNYFNTFEKSIWFISVTIILLSFLLTGNYHVLSIIASLIGVTALIFLAKGNVIGQMLTVVFSILYTIISYEFAYYGEMITYIGMTTPMAILSTISWLKNPFDGKKAEVEISSLDKRKVIMLVFFTIVVTILFYYILRFFNTTNLIFSTLSIATSFAAIYLSFYRSPLYALAYGLNDIVLIILWIFATVEDISYITMIICFVMFLVNDIYAYFNWKKMKLKQENTSLN